MDNSDSSSMEKALQVEKSVDEAFPEEVPPQEIVDGLEKQIETLSARCARLEAQNILVSVQQLDLLARGVAIFLSLLSIYYYWKLVWHGVATLPAAVELWLPGLGEQLWMKWVLHPLSLLLLKYLLAGAPYVHHKLTYGSAHRRFEVFAVAFIVILRMKMARWRERMFMTEGKPGTVPNFGEDMNEDAIWDANYEISARFLYVSILRLRGLWTKSAQYLSSRADFMPVSYVRELKKLQDEAPMTNWNDVQRMLKRAPGLFDELTDICEIPLASASIGQVHTARLKSTGEKVVFKVQHPHARTLLTDDFWSLGVIARIVSWLEPEYAFFEILMREWAIEAKKELDFVAEAVNLQAAQESINLLIKGKGDVVYTNPTPSCPQSVPFQVEIPRPIFHLSTNDVLVMSFCEGTRVDNVQQIEQWNLPCEAIMDAVAQTFAHMMYVTHIFNGDPHPGNIFIRPGTRNTSDEGFTVVLLDWGLAKQLPEKKRVAFCQMAYAAATFDYGLLLDAFKTVGLKLKRENLAEDMEGMRFFLRDMAPGQKARKRIKAKIKTDKARMSTKKKGERVPMESKAYPGEFFFFVRVNELLHGLGSRLSVEMAYLDVLKPYAERGLILSKLYDSNHDDQLSKPIVTAFDSALKEKIDEVLHELNEKKMIGGAQVCALDSGGRVLTSNVAGHLGGLKKNNRMRPDALVLGFSCTKAITATLAHVMVEEGYLTYDEPICARAWPAFCPTEEPPHELQKALITKDSIRQRWAWKRQITLRHILTHSSGLWSALPAQMTVKTMASCELSCAAFEYMSNAPEDTILPMRKPGEKCEYHYMSFGWLAAGTLCGAYSKRHEGKPCTFEAVYEQILRPRLSLETLQFGFRPCGGVGDFPYAETETADISLSKILQMRREAESVGEGEESAPKQLLDKSVILEMQESFRGKEFLLDPRIWNCEEALNANVPAAGGRFSAMGLAHFYRDFGTGRVIGLDKVASVTAVVTRENTANALQGQTAMTSNSGEGEGTSLGMGYQLIRFDGDSDEPAAFGHAGVGGSIGFHHRKSGISVGIMLNKADANKDTAKAIVQAISEHYKW